MRRQQLNLLITTLITLFYSWSLTQADPQTRLINKGCSTYNATNLSNFYQNLNTTLLDLKSQVGNENKHFATAQSAKGANPVYALFQCRNYLSNSDCSACFAVAAAQIRNCSAGSNGARVIYDGCFLRYESNGFFDQTTLPGNSVLCGTKTANGATTFNAAAQQILLDLQTATPKIHGFFAATKTQVAGNAIYAIAQCAETVTESGCLDCLTVGFTNIQGCFPNTDGEAFDAGCFMRYSEKSFFADNQTIDITPFLKQGSSSKKGAIIGGVVGGVVLVLILLALFVWFRLKKKPKRHPRAVKKLILGHSGKMDEQFESEAWKLYEVDRHLELVDKTLNPSDYDAEEVKKIIAIALLCTQATASTRPTMSEIVVLLKSKNFVEHMRPTMPVFVNSNLRPQSRTDTSTSTASSTSNATVSTSILSAR
ncbi:hypothetical protein TSUD_124000 [Trifolium subterraneum]|uniref:Gnk2-homologous domain-containing protein n=1 Tax=Trifolium subterraneum TaxID=3900 RepID=A0A2Z6NPU8_TRISU|nr:hypothetical protein TSUD_124000 [Trifolium subterraneum]